jgi:hypothetical protein
VVVVMVHGTKARPCTREERERGRRGGVVFPLGFAKEEKNRERVPCKGRHDQMTKFRRERLKLKNWRKRKKEKGGVVLMMLSIPP